MTHATLDELAKELVDNAIGAGMTIATAESCTGGMIAAAITDVAGSSAMFDRGFVTYSNTAKTDLLHVPADLIDAHGAVSEETARNMAFGALDASDADVSIAVTGIAGPGGGTAEKPVGLVYIGLAGIGRETRVSEFRFGDVGRATVRRETVREALKLLISAIEDR